MYCSEVEAALHAHPAVSQAAAFGVEHSVLGELVVAAVVLRATVAVEAPASIHGDSGGGGGDGGSTQAVQLQVSRELVEWCRGRLAHYKVPSQVSSAVATDTVNKPTRVM